METLALGSGEAVSLGSADARSSFVDELDGSIARSRDSSDADCEELGDGSSDGNDVALVRSEGVALDEADALALTLGVSDALAEGSISG